MYYNSDKSPNWMLRIVLFFILMIVPITGLQVYADNLKASDNQIAWHRHHRSYYYYGYPSYYYYPSYGQSYYYYDPYNYYYNPYYYYYPQSNVYFRFRVN